jgi:ATP-dependent DNA helicase RecQ
MIANMDDGLAILRTATGNPECQFRDGQWEAIDELLNHQKRALVVQSTSWGKSMVYFIATKLLRDNGSGPTIVISPLLALMRNQVEGAGKIGLKAETLNSSNEADYPQIKANILADDIDLILVSPEKLANDNFVDEYIRPIVDRVGMLVIDEAHCISDWGHDFRPDYKRIGRILARLPAQIPVVATTATANNRVVDDIIEQLGANTEVSRGPLIRSSLALDCVKINDPAARLSWLTRKLQELEGYGIVYVLTQADTKKVVDWLQKQGIDAKAYHGGIDNEERQLLEQGLINNEMKCLVATSALGMGFDKPDLHFVIHYQSPSSIVDYYQQVGRAGRGIELAHGYLVYGAEDNEINAFFRNSAFPPKYRIDQILSCLENSDHGMSIYNLVQTLNIRKKHIEATLKFLAVADPAPVIKLGSNWTRTPNAYQLDEAQIAHLTRQRKDEWDDIVKYGEKNECLMVYLAKKLDDPDPKPCGKCSVCTDVYSTETDYDARVFSEAQRFLKHSEMPFTLKTRFANPELGIQFGARNSLIDDTCQAEEGRVLSRYGEPIIGQLVKQCKTDGSFNDDIIDAAAELVKERWPEGKLASWVTCIPSSRHPNLVPQMARDVAGRLNLPFFDVLQKTKANDPQKNMENNFHQCENLLGAFSVNIPAELEGQPVLLIDDIVDSGWTLSIATYLLRSSGTGRVYPMALATSRPRG